MRLNKTDFEPHQVELYSRLRDEVVSQTEPGSIDWIQEFISLVSAHLGFDYKGTDVIGTRA